jgi:hypothetical protein
MAKLMAKHTGPLQITGTIGGITFYEMDGQFYARSKSSLDGRRVRKDPKFRRTMYEAGEFGKASKAARELYWQMPEEKRKHGMYGSLTGKMRKLLKAGKSPEEAKLALMQEFDMAPAAGRQKPVQKDIPAAEFTEQLLHKVFSGERNALPDVIFTDGQEGAPVSGICAEKVSSPRWLAKRGNHISVRPGAFIHQLFL